MCGLLSPISLATWKDGSCFRPAVLDAETPIAFGATWRLGHLQRENERLTHENLALRSTELVRAYAPAAPIFFFSIFSVSFAQQGAAAN